MIKNAHILEKFERQTQKRPPRDDWYKKADALYNTALSLNPESVRRGGRDHVEMLVSVRKKLQIAKTKMKSVK